MVLSVNDEAIDDAVLREERKALRRLLAGQMPDATPSMIEERAREWARENVVERVLLRQAAAKDATPIPPEAIEEAVRKLQPAASGVSDAEVRKEAEARLRVERYIAHVTQHVARPRRKDVVEYYKKNRAEFHSPEAIHAAHIVKNVDEQHPEEAARAAIEEIRDALHNGGSFEALADEFSDCPGRGGDLGFFPRGQMVPEFEAVAFSLSPGAISDIFRTPFGFHIVKAYSRRPEGVLPLEEVSDMIENQIFSQKKQKVLEQHLDSLRAKADVAEVVPAR
jgi:peptidyl-prolyl cis-trans isomerase C